MSKANKAKGGNRTVVIAAIGLAIVVAALLLVWRTMGPQSAAGGKTVTVQVVHEDGSSRDFTLNTDEEFLGAALIADGVVEDNQSAYGLYILTADGETADENEQQWWGYSVNGTFAELGVDSQPVADGDVYDFVLNVGW